MVATRLGLDPDCRFARVPEHLCVGNNGEPVRPGAECFATTGRQIKEQGAVLHTAEQAVGR